MCATIAAMAVQITKTQIATAMAAEISDIVSSFTFMILLPQYGSWPYSGQYNPAAAIISAAMAAA
jgi:hypothetical protein